jgi:hypothetical protein
MTEETNKEFTIKIYALFLFSAFFIFGAALNTTKTSPLSSILLIPGLIMGYLAAINLIRRWHLSSKISRFFYVFGFVFLGLEIITIVVVLREMINWYVH